MGVGYKGIVRREVLQVSEEQFSKNFILSVAGIDCIMMYKRSIQKKVILQFHSIIDKHLIVIMNAGEEPKL